MLCARVWTEWIFSVQCRSADGQPSVWFALHFSSSMCNMKAERLECKKKNAPRRISLKFLVSLAILFCSFRNFIFLSSIWSSFELWPLLHLSAVVLRRRREKTRIHRTFSCIAFFVCRHIFDVPFARAFGCVVIFAAHNFFLARFSHRSHEIFVFSCGPSSVDECVCVRASVGACVSFSVDLGFVISRRYTSFHLFKLQP